MALVLQYIGALSCYVEALSLRTVNINEFESWLEDIHFLAPSWKMVYIE